MYVMLSSMFSCFQVASSRFTGSLQRLGNKQVLAEGAYSFQNPGLLRYSQVSGNGKHQCTSLFRATVHNLDTVLMQCHF